jgi:uncharacterized phage protein gp47/JayE
LTLPAVGSATYPTVVEIRDSLLRTIKLGFQRIGLSANVLEGSENYVRADAIARRAVHAFANNKIALQDYSPLTAQGDNLVLVARVYGVEKRAPSKASGYVKITCSGTVTIPAGYQCTAPNGEKYQTTGVNTVATGAEIEVQAVNTGDATNQAAGTRITWDSNAVGPLAQVATVGAGAIKGGFPEDDQEKLRQRLINRLAFPGVGGNVSQTKAFAEDASAAVGAAYVYAAARGPASLDVVIVSDTGDRSLSDAIVDTVAAGLAADLPGHASINVTTVAEQGLDVVLLGTLPLPTTAGGAGGGWRDSAPWPSGSPSAGTNDGKVTAYDSGTGVATIRETSEPLVGQSIAIWDPDGASLYEYTLGTVGGSAGAWDVTVLDSAGAVGFKVDPTDAYVSAGAFNLQAYASTIPAEFLKLGPGEKTDLPELLPTARRQPTPDQGAAQNVDNRLLGNIQTAHSELEVTYGLRLETGTTTARTSPSIPATTADPPRILTLKYWALRKA